MAVKLPLLLLIVLLAPGLGDRATSEKLTIAHVAMNPSQGMLHLAKDFGILAKYGFIDGLNK